MEPMLCCSASTLDPLSALRYGERLILELEWTVEDGTVTHRLVGGDPPQCVSRLVHDFGDQQRHLVIEVNAETLRLQKVGGNDAAEWTRCGRRSDWQSIPSDRAC